MKIYFKIALILLVGIVIVIFVNHTISDNTETEVVVEEIAPVNTIGHEIIKKMNAIELHYDADGPFILIDLYNKVIGYYNASKPITHTIYYPHIEALESGVYKAYLIDDTEMALMNNNEDVIYTWGIPETHRKLIRYFINPCPALVYIGGE